MYIHRSTHSLQSNISSVSQSEENTSMRILFFLTALFVLSGGSLNFSYMVSGLAVTPDVHLM